MNHILYKHSSLTIQSSIQYGNHIITSSYLPIGTCILIEQPTIISELYDDEIGLTDIQLQQCILSLCSIENQLCYHPYTIESSPSSLYSDEIYSCNKSKLLIPIE